MTSVNPIQFKILDYLSKGAVSNKKIIARMVMLKKRYPNYQRYALYTPSHIQLVINDLTMQGIINEHRDVTAKISSLLQGRYGSRRIYQKLLLQGYAPALIKQVLKELETEVKDRSYDSISRLAIQKYKRIQQKYISESKHQHKQRLFAFIVSKGYDFDEATLIAQKALDN
ncbi:RecX family transcriptional regulator [Candidatus Falkowbacteria bacterium]|nr:RecX family transcriptional regulator [Candidatus Falkowbacteria bacterium]